MVDSPGFIEFLPRSYMARLESGFVYLWALFAVVLAGIVMAGAGQVWQAKAQREKEAELLYVGEQFRKAIMSYYNTGTKQFPESLEELLEDKRAAAVKRHLRKIYKDPLTNTTEWGIIEESSASNNVTPNANPASGNNPALNSNAATGNNPVFNAQSTPGSSAAPGSNPAASSSSTPGSAMPNSSPTSSNIDKRIIGVYSLSEKKPIKKDKFPEHFAKFSEAVTYRDWKFIYKPGDGSSSSKPSSSTPSKPNTTPGTAPANSPFASRPAATGNTSPFAPQSSATPDTSAHSSGFPGN